MAVAVVYWSGTGNTEAMAHAIEEGVVQAGGEAQLVPVAEFSVTELNQYDAFAWGSPACGTEELDESEFREVWDDCKEQLDDKPVVLFGSWGWGGGAFMDTWLEEAQEAGVHVVASVTCEGEPDDDTVEQLHEAAAHLV